MPILWRHWLARLKPKLGYANLETIFRFYANATARNEPLSTYMSRTIDQDPTSDPVAELIIAATPQLRQVAVERTKASQARLCRVLLLEYIEQSASDHYIGIEADEPIRDACLAAMYDANSDEEVERRHGEIIDSYFNTLWIEVSFACLYKEQFGSYMPLDSFSSPYRADDGYVHARPLHEAVQSDDGATRTSGATESSAYL